MDSIIWNVSLKGKERPEEGRYVVCSWNRQRGVYEVFFRGKLCGIVQLNEKEKRETPDFLLGKVIGLYRMHAQVRICRNRARSRQVVIQSLFSPAGAGAAA